MSPPRSLQSPVSSLQSIVLTGACGFIGRHVLAGLQDVSVPILAVDRVEPAFALSDGVQFHRSDLSDPSELIPSGMADSGEFVLVHLAWDLWRGGDYAPQLEQARMTASLLDYWGPRGLAQLIGMGSAEEYGRRAGRIHEYDPPVQPLSPYGLGKHTACVLASSWAHRKTKDVVWLRPFIVYGPGQQGDMMLPYAVSRAKARERAEFTDGEQERDFVDVQDVVGAIISALDCGLKGMHVFNLGMGQPVKVREVLMEIARLLDVEDLFRLGARPRRPGEPERQVADITAADDLLGWSPKVHWRDGIARMV